MERRERILRFPQAGDEAEFVIVQAVPSGTKPLDFDLFGTDGEAPFVASLRNGKWSKLKHSCGDDEWADILRSVLYQEAQTSIQPRARVDGTKLIVELRRNAAGITKHLGDLVLQLNEDQNLDTVGWCGVSVLAFDECNQELAELKAKVQRLERENDALRGQVDELVEVKKAEESDLMEKFRDLLNEKKVKIREQQRILATASVDEDKLAATREGSQGGRKGHKAGPSRTSKRKAAAAPEGDESDGADEADEAMDMDVKREPPSDSEGAQTTDADTDADATASEDDDDDGQEPLRAPAPKPAPAAAAAVPAKRDLPFATKKSQEPATKSTPAQMAPADGSETGSDDEL